MADFMTRPELAELFVDLFLLAASIVDISAARRVPWTTTRGKANVFFCLESVITWLFELLQSPPCEQAHSYLVSGKPRLRWIMVGSNLLVVVAKE